MNDLTQTNRKWCPYKNIKHNVSEAAWILQSCEFINIEKKKKVAKKEKKINIQHINMINYNLKWSESCPVQWYHLKRSVKLNIYYY